MIAKEFRRVDFKLRMIVDEVLEMDMSVADKTAALMEAGLPLERALALLRK